MKVHLSDLKWEEERYGVYGRSWKSVNEEFAVIAFVEYDSHAEPIFHARVTRCGASYTFTGYSWDELGERLRYWLENDFDKPSWIK